MNLKRTSVVLIMASLLGFPGGCRKPEPQYGTERKLSLAGTKRSQVWAVAPAINLSGEASVDPLPVRQRTIDLRVRPRQPDHDDRLPLHDHGGDQAADAARSGAERCRHRLAHKPE
jgi:hypothetical protein